MNDPLRQKTGQLFLVGIAGANVSSEERLLFQEYGFGGFILFKRNCLDAGQIAALCRDLWEVAGEFPPFIGIDEEGGRVHRLPPPFTHFPPAASARHAAGSGLAYRAARAIGTELALAGINLNFAPVLDLDGNPGCPGIGDRAFSADPGEVTGFGRFWFDGLRDAGIIPCGKHFPGHGAANKDSHRELPIVTKPWELLKSTDLAPFEHACRNGIDALMSAHVLYTALDPRAPATLSPAIVTGLLRQQLGYGGVVFSDDMDMRAISGRYTAGESALAAILAGVNVLLFCHAPEKAVEAHEYLYARAAEDAAVRARVDESVARVTTLKQRRLAAFTGVGEKEIGERLARLNHGRIVAEIERAVRV
jgi:beta-N-acetylhexosaminidase